MTVESYQDIEDEEQRKIAQALLCVRACEGHDPYEMRHKAESLPAVLKAAKWAFNLLEILNTHKNHPDIVAHALNTDGLILWGEFLKTIEGAKL